MQLREWDGLARWLVPLLSFVAVVILGLGLRIVLFRMLHRWASRTTSRVDDIIIESTRWSSVIWVFILALLVGIHTVDLPGEQADIAAHRTLAALLVLSITLALSRLVGDIALNYRNTAAPELAIASTGLLRTAIRGTVLIIGFLVILSTTGINIAPILGALGVGGLAAGLALQPTLSNLFAGFQIASGRQLFIGNRVRLASGEEGYITDIAWRTTTLRTPTNFLIIIPNSKLADTIVTNVNLPDAPTNIVFPVGVSYDSDPRHVEAVLREEAKRAVADMPQLVKDFDPIVRFQAFGESSLDFLVILRVSEHDLQFAIWGEIHQRIFERLQRENITIPFPARTVYLRGTTPEKLPT